MFDKRQANIEKDGIDFADLEAIFSGPIIERVDNRQNYGEIRVILVGTIDNIVLVVVYRKFGLKPRPFRTALSYNGKSDNQAKN
ncbi:BrnT family toxin [Microcystis aeruginosa]|uniref:BrnT family toxin n=1 Tax=Microcystis aeruginosa TaxID=1126 RepID=UPI0007952851|nr:BrnT family toxin [Microcystis aeruginosa]KXS93152.1 hypothetical protein OA58_06490 [Microcystis aeruginosa NIES-88]